MIRKVDLNFFPHTKLNIEAKSIFGIQYEGLLKIQDRDKPSGIDERLFRKLQSVIVAFTPPLYIGIAENLKTRLCAHKRQLEDCFRSGESTVIEINDNQLDTEEESSYFASRVAKQMRKYKIEEKYIFIGISSSKDIPEVKLIVRFFNLT